MKRIIAVVGLVLALVASDAPAGAIVGGEPDGNGHPNVGVIFAVDADGVGWGACSGTLLSPTVMVSAAHCFDPVTWAPEVIVQWLVTFDPAPTWDWDHMGDLGWLEGEPHIDPRWFEPYRPGGGDSPRIAGLSTDLAVLVLDAPASTQHPGIVPAPVLPRGDLDAYRTGSRNRFFTAVGYGVQRELEPPTSGGLFFDGTRNRATVGLHKLHPLIIETNGNYHDARGTGGACSGDSGGATFLGTQLAAVHSYGQKRRDGVCVGSVDGAVRLDTDPARAFLSQYLSLP